MTSSFLVRVELYGSPSEAHYQRLHSLMSKLGFSRTIRGDDGRVYDLPSATYYLESSYDATQVRTSVRLPVASVWRNSAVLVSRTTTNCWSGLREHHSRIGMFG